jgi:hypothetical protein
MAAVLAFGQPIGGEDDLLQRLCGRRRRSLRKRWRKEGGHGRK